MLFLRKHVEHVKLQNKNLLQNFDHVKIPCKHFMERVKHFVQTFKRVWRLSVKSGLFSRMCPQI